MPDSRPQLVRAWLDSLVSGVAEFDRDWPAGGTPRLSFGPAGPPLSSMVPAPAPVAGRVFGYVFAEGAEMAFVLPPKEGCAADPAGDRIFVAGDFNGWDKAVGDPAWELVPVELEGVRAFAWHGPRTALGAVSPARFKFVTGEHLWLAVANDAPNTARDEHGNINRVVDRTRTGRHLWRFTVDVPLDLSQNFFLRGQSAAPVPVGLGDFFHELASDLPLGPWVEGGATRFRLFAPRARQVTLHYCRDAAGQGQAATVGLSRLPATRTSLGIWETSVPADLDGWLYWYTLDGPPSGAGGFDPSRRVLDPYAPAALGPAGPGIVLSARRLGVADRSFRAPAWQDLIIAEAHVRDLAAHAPVAASPAERLGFRGLIRWVESPDFYLESLGINCVELQPVQQTDNPDPAAYAWGYMTTNFFAPEPAYSLQPEQASGVGELRDLVAAFHQRGMAVIFDVVFNHVGSPAHLMAIDRLYYFETDPEGNLSNWSGCGNDLRAGAAMSRRLIIDACVHLVEVYGIDGFRFDLAELIGVDVLREIEAALKRIKPDIILIAEPWSFRGHIAGALRDTGWASWNDGYRDFVREYVLGRDAAPRLEYFLRGSPWYFAKWPAQTVNYTQSHDDRTWIDMITENPNFDGSAPTLNDRRRTHLMAAVLFMSIGIPMLASGQDFFGSKRGENNTYLRGDLNALDYRRLYRFLSTHAYFAGWIEFRRGTLGRLVRQYSRPSEGFFRFFHGGDGKALAMLVNADGSQGGDRLLFAINPLVADATIALGADVAGLGRWRLLADQDRFYSPAGPAAPWPLDAELSLPGLSCGLWMVNVLG